MARSAADAPTSRCVNCGFEAASGGDAWDSIDVRPLGTTARCPECGSTNVLTGL